jgi:hypothetical protein
MRHLFFLFAALTASAATVEINLRDFAGASLNSQVTITNTSNPVFGGSNVYTLPAQKYQPRNGQVTATLHSGGYKALVGPYSIAFNVPDDTNTYTLSQVATNGSTITAVASVWYPSSNPSNYVTASITNGLGGGGGTTYTFANTNATLSFYTNGSTVLLGTNVVGGTGGSITNLTNGAYLADFGGVGDGRKLNSISIASGVVTAPSGTFSGSDTGKLFLAYLDSTNLTSTLTTIASYSNSTTVTLTDTGITTSSKDAIFGTDNTAAMSNALASLRYSGGTVHIKKGVYLFGSSHRSASGANTTIRMPVVAYNAPTNETITFAISGEHQPPMTYWVNNNGVPWYGTVLMDVTTPTANQTNAFFEDFTTADVFSPIRTKFENLTLRTVPNPRRTALYWKRGGGLHVTDCTFDADISEGYIPNTVGEPIYYPPSVSGTTSTNGLPTNSFAIFGPDVYNSGDFRVRDTSISYYGNAIRTSEHALLDNVNLTVNRVGLYLSIPTSVYSTKLFSFCQQYPIVAATQDEVGGGKISLNITSFGLENHDDYGSDTLGLLAGSVLTDVSNKVRGVVSQIYAYGSGTFDVTGPNLRSDMDVVGVNVPAYRLTGSNILTQIQGPILSELGAQNFSRDLMLDIPFLEGSGNYVWNRAKENKRFNPPDANNLVWTNLGRPAVMISQSNVVSLNNDGGWLTTSSNITVNVVFRASGSRTNYFMLQNQGVYLASGIGGTSIQSRTDDAFGVRTITSTVPNGGHDGNWHMITATVSTNTMRLYWDGVLMGQTNSVGGSFPARSFYPILGFNAYNEEFFCNRWQIWTRALDASEVKGLAMEQGVFTQTDGSGLTNLPASQLTGTVPNAALTGVSITNLDAIGTLESDPITVWPNGFQVTNTGSGLYAPITIGAENESVIWVNKIMNGAGDTIPRVNLAHSAIEGFLTNQSTLFIGGGSGLTNLNASQLTTGTVPAGRLTTAGTNLVGAVLTSDGVGNRYWTNALTGFSSVTATNLDVAGGNITNAFQVYASSYRKAGAAATMSWSGNDIYFPIGFKFASDISPVGFSGGRGIGAAVPLGYLNSSNITMVGTFNAGGGTITNLSSVVVDGYISSTNGFVDVPRSSAPTFVQIGSRTNTPVMWWSNSAPCVRYVTYYNSSSNAVTTNLFSLP